MTQFEPCESPCFSVPRAMLTRRRNFSADVLCIAGRVEIRSRANRGGQSPVSSAFKNFPRLSPACPRLRLSCVHMIALNQWKKLKRVTNFNDGCRRKDVIFLDNLQCYANKILRIADTIVGFSARRQRGLFSSRHRFISVRAISNRTCVIKCITRDYCIRR